MEQAKDASVSAARKLLVRDRALDADVPRGEAEEAAAPRTLISASMIPRFVISGFSSAVSWCLRTRGRDAMVVSCRWNVGWSNVT